MLISRHLRYDWSAPRHPGNDQLTFSKRHASPLLYAVFKAAGVVSDEELVNTYRQFGSRLQGHPPRPCPGSMWPPGHSARACRSGSEWRSPGGTWTTCRTTCGIVAAARGLAGR